MATTAGETVYVDSKGKYVRDRKGDGTYTLLMKEGQPVRKSLIVKRGLTVKGFQVFAPGSKKAKKDGEPAAPPPDPPAEEAPY